MRQQGRHRSRRSAPQRRAARQPRRRLDEESTHRRTVANERIQNENRALTAEREGLHAGFTPQKRI